MVTTGAGGGDPNDQTVNIMSISEGVQKSDPLGTAGEHVPWCSCHGKHYSGSSKKLKIELPYDPTIPLQGMDPKEGKAGTQMFVHPQS